MLKLLEIKDFRLFKDQIIHLGKHLTVISGHNATGKSTLLGIIANAFELKGTENLPLIQSLFRAEWSEIFKASKEHDKKCTHALSLIIDNRNLSDVMEEIPFRAYWNESETPPRFRLLPKRKVKVSGIIKDSAAKIKYPVLFLSLSRLFPIGESESDFKKNKSILTDEDKLWFIDNYNSIFRVNENINDVTALNIAELSKKKHIGIVTDQYDAITNSSGQSNISQILLALLSFKKLKEMQGDEYSGGILLIDEIESTLHPAAQVNLIKKFIELGKNLNLQILLTTHSLAVLKYICRKVNNNCECLNEIELNYLTKANDFLEIKRNVNFHFVESDMFNRCGLLSNEQRKLVVYSEDDEARWLLRKLIGNYSIFLNLIDISLGSDVLITFNKNDTTGHFKGSLIVLDGNEREKVNRLVNTIHNILLLPGSARPEEMIYNYLLDLPQKMNFL